MVNSTPRIMVLTAAIVLLFVTAFAILTSSPAPQVNWSPDGEWIVFSCSNISLSDPQSFLYIVRPDGSSLQRISYSRFVALSPTWSPDGAWIAFRSNNRLLKMRPDATEVQELTTCPFGEQIYTLTWSPSGEWIAFSTDYLGSGEITLFQPESSNEQTIFRMDGAIGAMAWSIDSEHIIFTVSADLPTSGVYIIAVESHQTELILNYQQIMGGFDISHDDASLLITLFQNRQPNLFLFEMNSNILTSLDVPNFDGTPTWSPSGEWIAYRGYDSQNDEMQIYRIRSNGQNLQKITDLEGCYPSDPDWISFEPEQDASANSTPY